MSEKKRLKEVTLSVNAPTLTGGKVPDKEKITRKLARRSGILNIKPSKELD